MTLLQFLNPVTVWQTATQIFRNERNHRFYNKKMRELDATGALAQFGMRLDMRNRAYYVINLEPETLLMGSEVLELEKSRVLESISLRKPVFTNADLAEIIEVKTERIKTEDHYAYLVQVKYRPLAKIQDHVYLFTWLGLAGFAAYHLTNLAASFL
jgi:hypothetical protein